VRKVSSSATTNRISVTDASDYTIPVHGEQRDLHHMALEICQDLITDEAGQRKLGV
jgi:predicted N-formylglutamate amidohydrolase